jgi:hypothetical protein
MLLVSIGTLVAAWVGANDPTWIAPILGVTMAICGVASSATALRRWMLAYRELERRRIESAEPMVVVPALGSRRRASPRRPVAASGAAIQHHARSRG